ncbi:conserved hypothetical protein [Carnobacterium maltaromaticum]|uniref:hypothetical protein n=1 Tax=Carnobacterium maltaromaticum TaxID=2751 RepID=UPI00191BBBDC|nr:hypothetical protein [Carnobacterium maltaromaticum]CAD5897855.1 conserved hypothetical protein [Carnobacterium maltaromaticum]
MEAINIQIKVFSHEKIKVNAEDKNVHFYKNDFLPEVILELAPEVKNKSLFGKSKLVRNSEWISNINELVKQIVIECHPLNNKLSLMEVLDDYSRTFNEENPELMVYQIFLKEEVDKVVLVLNFVTRFIYQDGAFLDSGIRKALMQQNVDQEGNILINWKNSEIKKITKKLLQLQELSEMTIPVVDQESSIKLAETVVNIDQEIRQLADSLPSVSKLEERVNTCQSEVDQVSEQLTSAKDKKIKLDKQSNEVTGFLSSLEQQVELLKVKMEQLLPNMELQNEKSNQVKQQEDQNELQELREKITKLEKANEEVDQLVTDSIARIAKQTQIESPLKKELVEMNKRLIGITENETTLKQQVKKLNLVISQQNQKHEAERQRLEGTIRQLELAKLDNTKKISNEMVDESPSKELNLLTIKVNENNESQAVQEKKELEHGNDDIVGFQNTDEEQLVEDESLETELNLLEKQSKKTPNWLKTKKMEAAEFNEQFRKIQYLEHAWMVHKDLSKKINQENQDFDENQEQEMVEEKLKNEINQVEIENFILNGEAANLRERVTFKNNRPFAKDRVILSNDDYELLVEKARQYEVIDYMNKQMTVKAREQA